MDWQQVNRTTGLCRACFDGQAQWICPCVRPRALQNGAVQEAVQEAVAQQATVGQEPVTQEAANQQAADQQALTGALRAAIEELMQEAHAMRADLQEMRRELAELKAEFTAAARDGGWTYTWRAPET